MHLIIAGVTILLAGWLVGWKLAQVIADWLWQRRY
jgi:hypothetical protein